MRKPSAPTTPFSILKNIGSALFMPFNVVMTGLLAIGTVALDWINVVEAYFVKGVLGRKLEYHPLAKKISDMANSGLKSWFGYTTSFVVDPASKIQETVGQELSNLSAEKSVTNHPQTSQATLATNPENLEKESKKIIPRPRGIFSYANRSKTDTGVTR